MSVLLRRTMDCCRDAGEFALNPRIDSCHSNLHSLLVFGNLSAPLRDNDVIVATCKYAEHSARMFLVVEDELKWMSNTTAMSGCYRPRMVSNGQRDSAIRPEQGENDMGQARVIGTSSNAATKRPGCSTSRVILEFEIARG